MDGNAYHPYDVEALSNEERDSVSIMSIEQLQRLIRLLDASDVSEIELKRAGEGTHLVLRKAKAPANSDLAAAAQIIATSNGGAQFTQPEEAVQETKHRVTAPLVGIFHAWARPKGGSLVAVGDHVKMGQLVATIESLNVLNEVEATAVGCVIEILAQEGQPVEYGQVLMTIDSAVEKT